MIQLFHIFKTFGSKNALSDLDLQIRKGEFVFITGPSGAGKTTLLRLIFGTAKPTGGQLLVNGINLSRIDRKNLALLRRKIGFVFQDFKLLSTKTVFDNVALALDVIGERRAYVRKKTHLTLRQVGLADKEKSFPLQLSGGEQQRVAIARAIVKDPLILLADEPTGNLDWDLTQEIMGLFEGVHRRGTTVLIATHSRELLETSPYRIIHLTEGKVVEDR
ncbi:MAG: cell division ATP-binding protein FtsE [Deltaproteobacteria bacterium]|nr:cell division ATP-binding protein FtsE [Deltaproteobacteria bacterium]